MISATQTRTSNQKKLKRGEEENGEFALSDGFHIYTCNSSSSAGYTFLHLYRTKKGIKERVRKETEPGYEQAIERKRKWREGLLLVLRRSGEYIRPKKEEDVNEIRKKLVRAGYQGKRSWKHFSA